MLANKLQLLQTLLKYESCEIDCEGDADSQSQTLSHLKIDVNIKNSTGNTPLHEAVVREASCDVVKALVLHKSCNLLIKNGEGKTPLQLAIFFESKLILMEAFLASGKVELRYIQDTIKETDVEIFNGALLHNHPFLVKKWTEVGCSVNAANSNGETPLHIVCREGHEESCLVLLQCKEINVLAQDPYGNAPIHIACLYFKEKCVKMLLDHNMCDPNQTNYDGDTPLHILCGIPQPDEKMISMLMSIPGINFECINCRGRTPLDKILCINNHHDI